MAGDAVAVQDDPGQPAPPEPGLDPGLGELGFSGKVVGVPFHPVGVVSGGVELIIRSVREQALQGGHAVGVFQGDADQVDGFQDVQSPGGPGQVPGQA